MGLTPKKLSSVERAYETCCERRGNSCKRLASVLTPLSKTSVKDPD
jgi:hypothetical protein